MKIEYNKDSFCDFSSLPVGQCFQLYGKENIYIKTLIVDSMGVKINSVCLNDGTFGNFMRTDKVKALPDAKVVIE